MSWAYWGGPAGGGGGCGLYCCDASEARRLSAAMLCAPLQSDASVAFTSAATQETPPPPPPLPEVVPGEPCPQFKADPRPPPWPPPTLDPPGGEPRDADTCTPPETVYTVYTYIKVAPLFPLFFLLHANNVYTYCNEWEEERTSLRLAYRLYPVSFKICYYHYTDQVAKQRQFTDRITQVQEKTFSSLPRRY